MLVSFKNKMYLEGNSEIQNGARPVWDFNVTLHTTTFSVKLLKCIRQFSQVALFITNIHKVRTEVTIIYNR